MNLCSKGQSIQGEQLKEMVGIANSMDVTMILDEFYSWYAHTGELGKAVSAAEYVEDCERDPVVLIGAFCCLLPPGFSVLTTELLGSTDGLTKNWRLPGHRVCWVVGCVDN